MTEERVRVVAAGVPRSYQRPFPDGRWLTEAHQAQIRAVSPRIELIHTARTTLETGEVPEPADVLLVESSGRKEYNDELPYEAFRRLVTPQLCWLQACSSGVGHILELDLIPKDVPITNAAGIHASALAESVLGAVLLHAKRLVERINNQRARLWTELHCIELRDKAITIIGTGNIGKATAIRAKVFGLAVHGVSRQGRPDPAFDAVFSRDHLHEALAGADFVVIACPLTPETEGMIDAAAIDGMKEGAYLINVARGRILDDPVVLDALERGHLGGAFLDAFWPEPLPADHPYWSAPNVTVTPHDSHSSEFIGDNMVDLFCANLRRWLDGVPLLNRIDPARGY